MLHPVGTRNDTLLKPPRCTWPMRAAWAWAGLLWLASGGSHAASVYRCVDAHDAIAYQDTPCAETARQKKIDVQPLPTIGDPAEVAARAVRTQATPNRRTSRAEHRQRTTPAARRRTDAKPEMSWECRAADGEVFYRHTRCPSSVPCDGVVRGGYAEKMSRTRTRGRHVAWSRVSVRGTKITRAEACRRIRSPSAAGRDGHLRDDAGSTYDRLAGRDPCSDA